MTINITPPKKNRQRSEIAIKIYTQSETYIYYFMPNTPKSFHSYNSIQNKTKQNNNQNSAIIAKHLKCICSFYFIACHTNCAMIYCKMPTIDFKWKFGETSFNNPNYNHFFNHSLYQWGFAHTSSFPFRICIEKCAAASAIAAASASIYMNYMLYCQCLYALSIAFPLLIDT